MRIVHFLIPILLLAILTTTSVGQLSTAGDGDCLNCHNDYVSSAIRHFLDSSNDCQFCHEVVGVTEGVHQIETYGGDNICMACHADHESGIAEQIHTNQECITCHNPHGSDHSPNLVMSNLLLCSESCHDADQLGLSHPIGSEAIVESSGEEMTCVSTCHSIHQPQEEKLLQYSAIDLCTQCHGDKY